MNVCRCLVRRPHSISRGKCVSGHVVRASSPLKCLDRDSVGRRPTWTRRGNAYRGVREKPGNVVYRQRVLQTVTSLSVVSLLFGGHNLLKIANINPHASNKPHFRYTSREIKKRNHQ